MAADTKLPKDEISELISKGRRQGFLLFEDIDKTFQDELDHGGNFDDFLTSIDDYGIKILDTKGTELVPRRRKNEVVTTQGLERTTDPVKLYLREMGNISLLTREGEIAIAREIERGEKAIVKALSKTRLVLNEVLSLEERIKADAMVIAEVFDVSEDDIAEGRLEDKKKVILAKIKKIKDLGRKLDRIPNTKRAVFTRSRIIVAMSEQIRDLNMRASQQERIIDILRTRLRVINDLEERREEIESLRQKSRKKKAGSGPRAPGSGDRQRPPGRPEGNRPGRPAPPQDHPGDHDRQKDQRPGQEGAGRGQPPAGRLHRQEIQQPRPPVPGFDPGREHGLDEGRGQIRIPARL